MNKACPISTRPGPTQKYRFRNQNLGTSKTISNLELLIDILQKWILNHKSIMWFIIEIIKHWFNLFHFHSSNSSTWYLGQWDMVHWSIILDRNDVLRHEVWERNDSNIVVKEMVWSQGQIIPHSEDIDEFGWIDHPHIAEISEYKVLIRHLSLNH